MMTSRPEREEVRMCLRTIAARLWSMLQGGKIPTREELETAYGDVLDALLQLFQCDSGCFVFLSRRDRAFEVIVAKGYGEHFKWWRKVRYGEGLVTQAAQTGKVDLTLQVKDCSQYKALNPRTVSQLTIPLLENTGSIEKSPFAVVALEANTALPAAFKELGKEIGHSLSETLSLFHGAMLAARMRKTFSQLKTISQQEDPDQCLELIAAAASSIAGSGEVEILQRFGGNLHVRTKQNLDVTPPPDLTIGISRGAGYTCYVAYTRVHYYCDDTEDQERHPYYRSVDKRTKSQYTTPLIFNQELVGVLNIGSRVPFGFTETDRDLIDMFAEHAANALYYSRLVLDLRTITAEAETALQFVDFLTPTLLTKLDKEQQQQMEAMQEAVARAKALVRQGGSQLGAVPVEEVAIVPLLQEVVAGFDLPDGKPTMRLDKGVDEGLRYSAVKGPLRDAVRSIVGNAVDAVSPPRAGHVEVAVETEEQYGVRYLCISVTDDGPGLSLEDQLLRPRSSRSSSASKGAAHQMSLWVCDRVLASYGGYLELAPAPGGGTVARLWLKIG